MNINVNNFTPKHKYIRFYETSAAYQEDVDNHVIEECAYSLVNKGNLVERREYQPSHRTTNNDNLKIMHYLSEDIIEIWAGLKIIWGYFGWKETDYTLNGRTLKGGCFYKVKPMSIVISVPDLHQYEHLINFLSNLDGVDTYQELDFSTIKAASYLIKNPNANKVIPACYSNLDNLESTDDSPIYQIYGNINLEDNNIKLNNIKTYPSKGFIKFYNHNSISIKKFPILYISSITSASLYFWLYENAGNVNRKNDNTIVDNNIIIDGIRYHKNTNNISSSSSMYYYSNNKYALNKFILNLKQNDFKNDIEYYQGIKIYANSDIDVNINLENKIKLRFISNPNNASLNTDKKLFYIYTPGNKLININVEYLVIDIYDEFELSYENFNDIYNIKINYLKLLTGYNTTINIDTHFFEKNYIHNVYFSSYINNLIFKYYYPLQFGTEENNVFNCHIKNYNLSLYDERTNEENLNFIYTDIDNYLGEFVVDGHKLKNNVNINFIINSNKIKKASYKLNFENTCLENNNFQYNTDLIYRNLSFTTNETIFNRTFVVTNDESLKGTNTDKYYSFSFNGYVQNITLYIQNYRNTNYKYTTTKLSLSINNKSENKEIFKPLYLETTNGDNGIALNKLKLTNIKTLDLTEFCLMKIDTDANYTPFTFSISATNVYNILLSYGIYIINYNDLVDELDFDIVHSTCLANLNNPALGSNNKQDDPLKNNTLTLNRLLYNKFTDEEKEQLITCWQTINIRENEN